MRTDENHPIVPSWEYGESSVSCFSITSDLAAFLKTTDPNIADIISSDFSEKHAGTNEPTEL